MTDKMVFPRKLKEGSQVRVIAPSSPFNQVDLSQRKTIERVLKELGLTLTYGKYVDSQNSECLVDPIPRASDLHEAFLDPDVDCILAAIGGYNSKDLLPYIKWEVVSQNPKIFCGFSDITLLQNVFTQKLDIVTYSGPMLSTFGMEHHNDQTIDWFKQCLFDESPYTLSASETYSDDEWWSDQEDRKLLPSSWWVINSGESIMGKIIGGNLTTLNLLLGTDYFPELDDTIVFVEDDYESTLDIFIRDITSLTQHSNFSGVKALIIGRFQNSSNVDRDDIASMVKSNQVLDSIPVLANVDFGHTYPMFTFPIGGIASISFDDNPKIVIVKH